ncbi:hypothetical protein UlMin_016554 [Ulmus minor]
MVNIHGKDREKASDSPRTEVGEIDTRAPFQSVKAAVNLFGVVSSPKARPAIRRRLSSENVLHKETQLLLAQREISKIKQKLESTENTKTRALSELEKAKRTLEELTTKLNTVNESKQKAIAATEVVKERAKKLEVEHSKKTIGTEAWKRELDHTRKEYIKNVTELNSAKQELTKIRQDFDAALEAKLAAFQQAAEAQRSAKLNAEKASELSREIATMNVSMEQLKIASVQAQQEQVKTMVKKDASLLSYRTAKEETEKTLVSLKEQVDPEFTRNIEVKLEETIAEIESVQEEMKQAHASEMDAVRAVTMELNEATMTLQEFGEEESSLRNLASVLRQELESVKKEKEMEMESVSAKLNTKLHFSSNLADEKEEGASNDHSPTLEKLLEETENAKKEEEETKINGEKLKQEAKDSQIAVEETEKKLQLALQEVEEAKAAERKALDEMKILSPGDNEAHASKSKNNGKMKLSMEEFGSLTGKVEKSQNLVEKKVAESEELLEEINDRTRVADKKLEANLKAIEEIKAATDMALKQAEMAGSAKTMVEVELRRWRNEEQKEAAAQADQAESSSGFLML